MDTQQSNPSNKFVRVGGADYPLAFLPKEPVIRAHVPAVKTEAPEPSKTTDPNQGPNVYMQFLDPALNLGPNFDLGIQNYAATGPNMTGFSKAYSLVLEAASTKMNGEICLSHDAAQRIKPHVPGNKFSCAVWNTAVLDEHEYVLLRACSNFSTLDGPRNDLFFLVRPVSTGKLELLVSTQHLHPDKMSIKFTYEREDFTSTFAAVAGKAEELRLENGMYWTEAEAFEAKSRAVQFEFPGWKYQKDGNIRRTMEMEDDYGDYIGNEYEITKYGEIRLRAGTGDAAITLGSCSNQKQAFLAMQSLERMLDDMNWENSVPEDVVAPFSPTREQDLQAVRASESREQQSKTEPAENQEAPSAPVGAAVPEDQRPHLYVYPPEYPGDQERSVIVSDPVWVIYLPDGSRAITSEDGTRTLIPAGFHSMLCGSRVNVDEAPISTLYL